MSDSPVQPTLADLADRPGREALDPGEVAAVVRAEPELAGWSVEDGELAARFATGDFVTALRLANVFGEAAEEADHHPDLTVGYGRLGVRMHSHDVSGLTSRDLRLAKTLTQLAAGLGLTA